MRLNKKSIAITAAVVLGLGLLYFASTNDERKMLKQVKSGEKYLFCNFKDGERVVNPEVIKGFSSDVWFFENGYAKNCVLK